MRNSKSGSIKKALLLLCSGVLLISGGTLLYKSVFLAGQAALSVKQSAEPPLQPAGAFPTSSLNRFQFSDDGKDLFSLLVARYQDTQQLPRSAILFPADPPSQSNALTSPTGLRQQYWAEATSAIVSNAPKDALILSWWDDGQRVHFLSGLNAWLNKPAAATFAGEVWQALQPQLSLASSEEMPRLSKMAAWLTMDSDKALAEIAANFGKSQPIYLLVSNDLLLRQGELVAYGGSTLSFHANNIPAGADLHGDIAQVKRWAAETGEGNYLVQKEGQYYRAWSPSDPATKNALLVRLLPFIDSLKQLPKGVERVYQSGGGGYLSVYKLGEK
ncbi:MAG: hydroxylamine oxidation protein HaoB [Methylococcaceae bacterium]|nr:hydroxylamine oxidation protein HaoB [Methylococcaceae bacterium]